MFRSIKKIEYMFIMIQNFEKAMIVLEWLALGSSLNSSLCTAQIKSVIQSYLVSGTNLNIVHIRNVTTIIFFNFCH